MRELAGYKALKVYQLAYSLTMEIFRITKEFPREERYSMTDQIRRSSRSVVSNIAEGYRLRRYSAAFVKKLVDADGSSTETQVWLDLAFESGYLPEESHRRLTSGYEEVGRMLGSMIAAPERLAPFC